jgi:hypothetical protein
MCGERAGGKMGTYVEISFMNDGTHMVGETSCECKGIFGKQSNNLLQKTS